MSGLSDLAWSELAERACRERDQMQAERDAAQAEAGRLRARATRLREQLESAVGSMIYQLEQREEEEGRPVWGRELVADGHHRVDDIREFRDFLAEDAAQPQPQPTAAGPEPAEGAG